MVLACAAEEIDTAWMEDALRLHGETLADENFYVHEGNHAFNQAQGLLALGCVLGETDWIDLGLTRISDVAKESVDAQGVTNEQAVGYQLYNYVIYREATDRLAACGHESPSGFERVDLMPEFLAHATLPNGNYVMLGDTEARPARKIRGTIAEFAATKGERGPKPDTNVAIYDAGFVLVRTGWGEDRPIEDEVFVSARFRPPKIHHGHVDGGSLTVYGYGSPLIVDSGKYTYAHDEWRDTSRGQPLTMSLSSTAHPQTTRPAPIWSRARSITTSSRSHWSAKWHRVSLRSDASCSPWRDTSWSTTDSPMWGTGRCISCGIS